MIIRERSTGALLEVVAAVTTSDDDGNDIRLYWTRPIGAGSGSMLTPIDAADVEEVAQP